MFSYEFCEILKKTFFYRAPPVAAPVLWKIVEDLYTMLKKKLNIMIRPPLFNTFLSVVGAHFKLLIKIMRFFGVRKKSPPPLEKSPLWGFRGKVRTRLIELGLGSGVFFLGGFFPRIVFLIILKFWYNNYMMEYFF